MASKPIKICARCLNMFVRSVKMYLRCAGIILFLLRGPSWCLRAIWYFQLAPFACLSKPFFDGWLIGNVEIFGKFLIAGLQAIPLHTSRRDRLVNCRGLPFTLAFCA
ncbi:hypothetical protein, partial [Burkholderia ubonensis]|uniref:hypothetical protein n=1 Tax=Burkholderia ubonensis TaxID=101571 RepID=UPI001E5C41B1